MQNTSRQTKNYTLVQTDTRLELHQPNSGPIYIDFLAGRLAYRRKHSNGKHQALARAVGIKGRYRPQIIDATAGLGRDAFMLACLGCPIVLIERHPIIAALLADGLQRLYADHEASQGINMQLLNGDASEQLINATKQTPTDVIYLDPMFPSRQKSALVKKEMQLLHTLAGSEPSDVTELLTLSRQLAQKRVVVKRPKSADYLAKAKPTTSIKTASYRFDLYINV